MSFMNEQTIIQAIENRRLLEFEYHDRLRLVEPHILGICYGVAQLLAYQIAGESQSGGLPEWRRFDVEKMQSLKFTRYVFEGSGAEGGMPTSMGMLASRWCGKIKALFG
jgi:hypothetical protein